VGGFLVWNVSRGGAGAMGVVKLWGAVWGWNVEVGGGRMCAREVWGAWGGRVCVVGRQGDGVGGAWVVLGK